LVSSHLPIVTILSNDVLKGQNLICGAAKTKLDS
jgi:hypothetical protein